MRRVARVLREKHEILGLGVAAIPAVRRLLFFNGD
jgi:hypothetical protein